METLDRLIWVVFPYLCMAIFVFGHIYRYRVDKFHWTAKSSEFIEKKQLMIGSLMFHLGIIPVIFGHIGGLAIPIAWMNAIGVNDHLYHIGAIYIGGIFGFMTLIGMIILTFRRFSLSSVRKLSSFSDLAVNSLLLFIVFVGMYATLVTNVVQPDFDYRMTISVWFRDLFLFRANPAIMADVPWSFKIHVLTGFAIFAFWPFTRLVHVWSVPLNYVGRSYILYRRHKPTN
ncbi:respiratory nitrate reductase subunit gamma [Microbacterium sp. APC 3898]|jgi:nitrate reductase gamma subunit|uniref:Respiratory nitrate reductase subunit gamma n=2 Tax=Planococcus TaxID=1372 RepID=A0ABT7ZGF0_9BACL|nr:MULTISPECIES: respiratory nitrate reductase subunit gamma [Terrabacteria group]MBF6633827.1 respiratory nitrate reductase subunit gamma [Planococcus sp. (in: firmicutes)]MBD8013990.1 respiratory nitrate reductase subunit gamma [Planococcus wigleyi]MDN3426231.1 respiratory nitrate reductase subunit gamma [Planococcus sp. APC 4016]MDN3438928.1 respiratory nitrate reductase subunit gamma [Planococcus sp. APC 3900]MDN3497927.1 respiratory nitrate reductase subunit gamma [Microbacterium sp. APC 